MSENKVQFNLKNVHYAILTETVSAGVTTYAWGTPVKVPGAVELSLDQQGDINKFYADGMVYYKSVTNNGYEGDLTMARIVDQMLKDIWGNTLGATSKVLTENALTEPKSFALLFQIDGDASNDYFVLYSCTGTRPAIASKTNEDTKEPQTQKSTVSATPLADGRVMARTTADTPASVKSGWFGAVFTETGAGAYVVEYDANGGTGAVVDGNSPYVSGATATVMHADGIARTGKAFSKWNTAADGSGTDYQPGATMTVNANVKLYAIWA